MKMFMAVFLSMIACTPGFAACSGSISGQSSTVGPINISDGGCAYDAEQIFFFSSTGIGEHYPFNEECNRIENGFKCRINGRTPLAGTTYKLEMSGIDPCDETGKTPSERYRCAQGCEKLGAPTYLEIEPYEC